MQKPYIDIITEEYKPVIELNERLKCLAKAHAYAQKVGAFAIKPRKRSRYRLMLCDGALSCIQTGDRWGVDFFMHELMGFKAKDPEGLLILWQELGKQNWRNANDPIAYLKTSLFREFKRRKIRERKAGSFVSIEGLDIDIADDSSIARLETKLAIEQLAVRLTAEERAFLRLFITLGSWRMAGLKLFDDPNRGRVLGQKIMRKMKKIV